MRLAARAERKRESEVSDMTALQQHEDHLPDPEGLRQLLAQLKQTEVADLDERVGQRVGAVIARAAFDRQNQ